MSGLLFDERGERAQKLMAGWVGDTWTVVLGHTTRRLGGSEQAPLAAVLGFHPQRSWRPTYFAAKMAKGYRVFELDVGVCEYVEMSHLTSYWQPASPDHKRLPHIAAVEVWIRHKACA